MIQLRAALLTSLVGVALAAAPAGTAAAASCSSTLSALGAALRRLGAGTVGVETVFFLLVLAGRVFGPGSGFVLGTTTTLVASALLTGGVGPWLPFQMLGGAWFGLGAGLRPRVPGRAEIALLAGYSAVASLLYGALLNLSFWPFALASSTRLSFNATRGVVHNLHTFLLFNLSTSMGWDLGRSLTTATLVVLTGPAVLVALRRASRRAAFQAPVDFVPAVIG
ncbi:MAG: hypothetical protein NVS3B26_08240 [Mycobacteriales bacterium]